MDHQKETDLLKKIKDGSHEAFNMIFIENYPQVKRFLYGFLKDEDDASDLAQDIFVKLWQNRENLTQIENFKAYLFRMAKNTVFNYFEHTLIKENYRDKVNKTSTIYYDVIEQDIYAKELSDLLDLIIERMPEQRKRVFKMSRKEGLSNEQIALQLNINKRTVENHITTALAELRKVVSLALFFFI